MLHEEGLTREIIGSAIEVHRELGPGLLESVYEECLCHELGVRQFPFRRQVVLPLVYKKNRLDCGFRADVVIADKVLIEIKAVETVTDLHRAQLLTYLHITKMTVGLILNFNSVVLKDGLARMVL